MKQNATVASLLLPSSSCGFSPSLPATSISTRGGRRSSELAKLTLSEPWPEASRETVRESGGEDADDDEPAGRWGRNRIAETDCWSEGM